jgi:hypothetical protein
MVDAASARRGCQAGLGEHLTSVVLNHSLTCLDQVGAVASLVFQHLNYGTKIGGILVDFRVIFYKPSIMSVS